MKPPKRKRCRKGKCLECEAVGDLPDGELRGACLANQEI
jgi:hypothetical protein